MESTTFLTINGESISLNQTLKYLRNAGSFPRFINDVLRQHLLETELAAREDIKVSSLQVDQAIMDFRVQSKLTDAKKFQQWLGTTGNSYENFQSQIAFAIKVEKLKTELSESKLTEYFEARKPLLDKVVLSRIILEDQKLADNLQQQLMNDPNLFFTLASKHSLAEDRSVGGKMKGVRKGQLPEVIRNALDTAQVGQIIGPITIDNRFCIFSFEEVQRTTLDEVKLELRNQIFEEWVGEKLTKMEIKLEV